MLRAIALGLLFIVSFPLIPWATSVDSQSNLPACCRRDGKHHCGMVSMDPASSSSEASIKAVKARCPLFPTGHSSPAGMAFFAAPPQTVAIAHFAELRGKAQTEARYRISFNRSRHKRGPPSQLS